MSVLQKTVDLLTYMMRGEVFEEELQDINYKELLEAIFDGVNDTGYVQEHVRHLADGWEIEAYLLEVFKESGAIDWEEEIADAGGIAPGETVQDNLKVEILNRLNESLTLDELCKIEKKLEKRLK